MGLTGKGLLFVYGTLLTGSETPASLWLQRRMEPVGAATITGRLKAIPDSGGWYPALLPARQPSDRVHGMLLRHRLTASERLWLDRYEGADYRLVGIGATIGNHREIAAAYRWIAPFPRGARPISHGDFLRWLGETGRSPYSEPQPRHLLQARPLA